MGKVMRKIITIDEERCDGCGLCVPACAEGALQIIDGKARLVSDVYCDGLGACLGECPQNAITIIERPADEFDARAVENHLQALGRETGAHDQKHRAGPHAGGVAPKRPAAAAHVFGGCPGARTLDLRTPAGAGEASGEEMQTSPAPARSELKQWPVKLYLVSPNAPYFQNVELLIAADCAPVAYASFHADFLKGKAAVIGCPKFDDLDLYRDKLAALLRVNDIKKVTVLHMEVPCCFGLAHIAREAIAASGKNVPLEDVTVGIRGDVTVGAGV